jgi:hypothetical protein
VNHESNASFDEKDLKCCITLTEIWWNDGIIYPSKSYPPCQPKWKYGNCIWSTQNIFFGISTKDIAECCKLPENCIFRTAQLYCMETKQAIQTGQRKNRCPSINITAEITVDLGLQKSTGIYVAVVRRLRAMKHSTNSTNFRKYLCKSKLPKFKIFEIIISYPRGLWLVENWWPKPC